MAASIITLTLAEQIATREQWARYYDAAEGAQWLAETPQRDANERALLLLLYPNLAE